MSLPYDPKNGYGVIVAKLATGVPTKMCDKCCIGLAATDKELKTAKKHKLPVMDRQCAEQYVFLERAKK